MARLNNFGTTRPTLQLLLSAALLSGSVLLSAGAHAQGFQQTFTDTAPGQAPQTETLIFQPASPVANINLNDPILQNIYNNIATAATSTITTNGSTVATFSSAAGSRAVTVQIPSIGRTLTFSGGDRAGNYSQALFFAEQQAPGLFVSVNPFTRPTNPANPAVGNPFSLAGQMVGRDFRMATGIGEFDATPPRGPAGLARVPNAVTAGGEFSYASVGSTELWTVTVPIDYKIFFSDPRYSINIDVPITFMRIANQSVGMGSVGTTFKFPLTDVWSLGVGVRAGAVGSEGLLLGDTSYSGTLSSQYNIFFDDYKLTIGNSIGFLKTLGFRAGNNDAGPSRNSVPIANGIGLEGSLPFTLLGKPASYEAYVVDTYFAGQPIAIRHYDEIGFNIGTRGLTGEQSWNNARFGIAYTVGKSFNAASLRFSYRF